MQQTLSKQVPYPIAVMTVVAGAFFLLGVAITSVVLNAVESSYRQDYIVNYINENKTGVAAADAEFAQIKFADSATLGKVTQSTNEYCRSYEFANSDVMLYNGECGRGGAGGNDVSQYDLVNSTVSATFKVDIINDYKDADSSELSDYYSLEGTYTKDKQEFMLYARVMGTTKLEKVKADAKIIVDSITEIK